jgi:hypothetical protein
VKPVLDVVGTPLKEALISSGNPYGEAGAGVLEACCGWGGGEAVCRRALTRARAATAGLPYLQHLFEVPIAWLLLFAPAPPLLDPVAIYLLLRQLDLSACSDRLFCRCRGEAPKNKSNLARPDGPLIKSSEN